MNETDKFIADLVKVFRADYSLLYDFDLIFSTNDLQIDLLNETACGFFQRISGLYSIYFFLSISKMLDPAEQGSGKYKNISLCGLLEYAKGNQNYDQLKKKIDAIKSEVDIGKIRQARNERITHTAINFREISSLSIEFEKIKELYDRIGECIKDVIKSLGKQPGQLTPCSPDSYGAMTLLECLKDCLIYREVQINRRDTLATHNEAIKTKYGQLKFEFSLLKS